MPIVYLRAPVKVGFCRYRMRGDVSKQDEGLELCRGRKGKQRVWCAEGQQGCSGNPLAFTGVIMRLGRNLWVVIKHLHGGREA